MPIFSIHFVKYMFRNCVMFAQDIKFISVSKFNFEPNAILQYDVKRD